MTLRCGAERLSLPSDMTGGLSDVSDFGSAPAGLYSSLSTGMPENNMDEILDFSSLLMKLVLILLVALMAATLLVVPESMMESASSTLWLVAPLFVLTTVLDLIGAVRGNSPGSLTPKPSHDFPRS